MDLLEIAGCRIALTFVCQWFVSGMLYEIEDCMNVVKILHL